MKRLEVLELLQFYNYKIEELRKEVVVKVKLSLQDIRVKMNLLGYDYICEIYKEEGRIFLFAIGMVPDEELEEILSQVQDEEFFQLVLSDKDLYLPSAKYIGGIASSGITIAPWCNILEYPVQGGGILGFELKLNVLNSGKDFRNYIHFYPAKKYITWNEKIKSNFWYDKQIYYVERSIMSLVGAYNVLNAEGIILRTEDKIPEGLLIDLARRLPNASFYSEDGSFIQN